MATGSSGEDDGNIFIHPQCLIDTNEEGRFVVYPAVLDQLRRLDDDVIVVAVVGPYRTGKSYLMNRLCGHNTGFPLGSTVQSKTKGIWIWVRVHPDNPEKYLVVLDTEGLGDVEKGDCNHDNAISCLATLLSSTLVYNILGRIDSDTLNKLHFISQLSNHIYSCGKPLQNGTEEDKEEDNVSDKQEEEEEDKEEEEEFDANAFMSSLSFNFPDFVFVLRDFDLELKMDNDDVTTDEYLERNLSLKPGSSREIKNCNRVRCSLRQAFTRRNCFTFVRPVHGKTKCLEKMTDDELESEFIDNTGTFIHFILERSRVKLIDGRRVNGKVFSSLVSLYVDQMNNGALPSVMDAVSIIRKQGNEEAAAAALALYDDQMLSHFCKKPLPVCEADFIRIHNECLQEALRQFQSEAIFLDEDASFQETLTSEIFVKFKDYSKHNEIELQSLCHDVLKQQHDETVRDKVLNGVYKTSDGYQTYKEDMKRLEEKYEDTLGSMALKSVLYRFRDEHYAERVFVQAGSEVVQVDQKTKEEQKRVMVAQRQLEESNQRQLQQEQLMRQRDVLHEDVKRELSRVAASQQQQMRQRHNEVLEQRLSEQTRLLQEGFSREAAQLNSQIEALQRR